MVGVSRGLQALEQRSKVNVLLTRVEMHLFITQIIGQTYFTNARDAESIMVIASWNVKRVCTYTVCVLAAVGLVKRGNARGKSIRKKE